MHPGFDPCKAVHVWEPLKEHPLGLGSGASHFVTGLSISEKGVIAVAEEEDSRQIHMFDSEYHLLRSFKVFDTTPVVDNVPAVQGLAFGFHGNLYVCGIQMQGHSGLVCFNANGKKVAKFCINPILVSDGAEDGMVVVTGVGVDSKNDVYFSIITIFGNDGDYPGFDIGPSFLCVCRHGTTQGGVLLRYAEMAISMTLGPNNIIYSSNESGVFSVNPATCVVQKVGGEDAEWKQEQYHSTINVSGDGYIFLYQSMVPGLQIFSMEGKEIGHISYNDQCVVIMAIDPKGYLHVLPVMTADDKDDLAVKIY